MVNANDYWNETSANMALMDKLLAPTPSKKARAPKPSSGLFVENATPEEKPWWETALDTPIVKGALNALSVGTYWSANTADQLQSGAEKLANGDLSGLGQMAIAPAVGVGKGLSAAAGNENDVKTWADIIKKEEDRHGIDDTIPGTEFLEGTPLGGLRSISGVGGLIGDVALDPTTYMGVGLAAHGIKGAVNGVTDARILKRLAEGGVDIGEKATTPLKGAVEGAKKEVANYRWDQWQTQEAKGLKKAVKKNQPVDQYQETIVGFKHLKDKIDAGKVTSKDLRAAANKEQKLKAETIKSKTAGANATDLMKMLVNNEIDPKVAEAGFKTIANAAEEFPVGQFDSLAKPEPKTIGETVVSESAPRAAVRNTADVNTITEPKRIIDDTPSEAKFSDYANYTPVDRFVMGTEHLVAPTPKYTKPVRDRVANYIAQHPGTINGKPDVHSINLDDLYSLGVKPEDAAHVMVNGTLDGIAKNSGAFKDIFNGIRTGNVAEEDVAKFHDFMKGFTNDPNINVLDAVDRAEEFVKNNSEAIQKSSRSFAPTAINGRLVNLNIGAGKAPAISIMKTLPSETANMFRRPLSYEQSQQYLGDALEQTKVDILNGYNPAETAAIADKVLGEHFKEYSTPSGIYRTNNNWGTSTRRLIDGDPKKENWWTTHSAIDLFSKIQREISKTLRGTGVKGAQYSKIQDDMFMRVAAHVDTQLKGHGIFPYLTNVMPEGGMAIRASMYDVLQAMGPELRKKYIFVPRDTPTNLMVTQLMDLSETLMRSIAGVELTGKIDLAIIKPDAIRVLQGEFRNLADEKGIIRAIDANLDPQVKAFNDRIVEANIKGYKNALKSRNKLYGKAFDDFVKIGPDGSSVAQRLAETVLRNTSLHSSQLSHIITVASDEALSRLTARLNSGSVGSFAKEIADLVPIKSDINPEAAELLNKKIAEVKRQFTTPREEVLVNAQEEVAKQNKIQEAWAGTAKNEKGARATPAEVAADGKKLLPNGKLASSEWGNQKPVRNVKREKATAKANAKLAARTGDTRLNPDNLGEALQNGGTDTVIDLARQQQAWDVATRMFGFRKFFDRQFGMRDSFAYVTSGIHFGTHLETSFHESLNDFAAKYKAQPEAINHAFKELQDWDNAAELSPVAQELQQIAGHVFDSSEKNFYARNGVGAAHMNSILKNNPHAPEDWRFPQVAPDQMAEVWKAWNVRSPLKMLAVVHTAMIKASEDISMGARFSEKFGLDKVPVGEAKDWVKVNNADGKNAFATLIDTDLYYPREIVNELPALSHYITEARAFKNEFLNKWITEVFDPFTSALKLTQTTMKPGHHVMSIGGDALRNSLAGMNFSTREYKHAWKIIRTRQAAMKELSNLDQYANIKAMGTVDITGLGEGVPILINGKKVNISYDSMYKLMIQRDMHLPGHGAGVAEDLLTTDGAAAFDKAEGGKVFGAARTVAQGFNKGLTKLTNNKLIKLNKFSAERDNLMRGALAIHFMQKKSFKSIEEAVTYASEQIRKWAPTAKDLTAAESKSLRRIFFYYTWQRGILPRVIESAVTRPGWATMPSKAMYNLAIANGLNPDSIGDPFPPEALMPDYYRQNVLGPQWRDDDGHYWGFNPTSPVMDIMNSLGSGVSIGSLATGQGEGKLSQTLMGMLHPAFKAPIELGSGTSLSTGAPIVDSGEYVTDMIGPARVVSKITGHTINPAEIIGPNGVDFRGAAPHRTEAKFKNGIAPADWANNAALELINYGTGAQVKDFTSDSAMKSAKFQQRDQVKQQKADTNRTEWWK